MEISDRARQIAADVWEEEGYITLAAGLRKGDNDRATSAVVAQRALNEPRAPMSEDEIVQRARKACCTVYTDALSQAAARRGNCDLGTVCQAAAQALRDIDKPLTSPDPLAALVDAHLQRPYSMPERDSLLAFARKVRDL